MRCAPAVEIGRRAGTAPHGCCFRFRARCRVAGFRTGRGGVYPGQGGPVRVRLRHEHEYGARDAGGGARTRRTHCGAVDRRPGSVAATGRQSPARARRNRLPGARIRRHRRAPALARADVELATAPVRHRDWTAGAAAAAVLAIGVLVGAAGHSPTSVPTPPQASVAVQPIAQVGTNMLASTVSLSSQQGERSSR